MNWQAIDSQQPGVGRPGRVLYYVVLVIAALRCAVAKRAVAAGFNSGVDLVMTGGPREWDWAEINRVERNVGICLIKARRQTLMMTLLESMRSD
ncbi:unnamed protein product [Fusarium venenatum]|uniref:Uncharacterized protein n=1 Tax=Fusarium venenatum TaxID=56646 RepID=A0A2L2SQC3_9HYPO|nr:uncharacterized protein FVRRES_12937 [Fusarium venenatum]CEI40246.1 unnamed protein product [Fusarium venenatum]